VTKKGRFLFRNGTGGKKKDGALRKGGGVHFKKGATGVKRYSSSEEKSSAVSGSAWEYGGRLPSRVAFL